MKRESEEDLQEGGFKDQYADDEEAVDWSEVERACRATSSTRRSWGNFPGDSSSHGDTAMDEIIE